MKKTKWNGRFSVISENPYIILDGAHNKDGAEKLIESLKRNFNGKKINYIFGVFSDKDYKGIIEITAPFAKHIITTQTPKNSRALNAKILEEAVKKVNTSVEAISDVEEAVKKGIEITSSNDVLVIFGSLSFLGKAWETVYKIKEGVKTDGQ